MRCIRPLKASQSPDGKITFNYNQSIPGMVGFEFECRKCLPCRLNIAREKAIRAYHESSQHEDNIFLTLTYDDDHIGDNVLQYRDFQLFMKKLRLTKPDNYMPFMVTGEYGEKTKRKHWHAIIFNYSPSDATYKYTTDLNYKVFESEKITKLWKKGNCEFGDVSLDSASYVARYSAKKLCHGKDEDHQYHPVHKVSTKRAIGRSWIEKYHEHTFQNGFVVLPNGETAKIPRYYADWCRKNKPELYKYYVTQVREKIMERAEAQQRKEELQYLSDLFNRRWNAPRLETRPKVKLTCLKQKFKRLQENLKL